MKSKRRPARLPKNASSPLAPKLAAYSATAAATLAFAPNAQAQVIPITAFSYSGNINTTTPPSLALTPSRNSLSFFAGPFKMQVGGYNSQNIFHGYYGGNANMNGFGTGNNHVQFAGNGSGGKFLKLGLGDAIKGQTAFWSDLELAQRNSDNLGYNYPFQPHANGAVTGYIGFKGTNAGHNYYGWLRLKVTADANGFLDSVSLVAKNGSPGIFGAYDISTDPNINSFGTSSVPEPADAAFGLGLLAFGAVGVREMRRRRKVAA